MSFVVAFATLLAAGTPARATESAALVLGAGEVFPSRPIPSGPTWGAGLAVHEEWAHALLTGTAFLGGGGSWSNSWLRGALLWLPLSGDWSPYLGGGGGVALIGKKRDYQPTGEGLGPPYLELLPVVAFEGGVELLRSCRHRVMVGASLELPWSRPFRCNADFTSCGESWTVRYPVAALQVRLTL